MPPADAAVLSARSTSSRAGARYSPTLGTMESLDLHLRDFPRDAAIRVVPVVSESPTPMWPRQFSDVSPDGLGPSVAELTIGRPPRAPRE